MDRHIDPVPVPTDIIRTPVSGPAPANTLVFLRCRGSGADISLQPGGEVRYEMQFATKFRIDGYQQSEHDWYVQNTQVSATCMLRLLNTSTDMEFLAAVDTIEPFIDLDGSLNFICQMAMKYDGLGLFEYSADFNLVFDVSAYVLCREPHTRMPDSAQLKRWREGPSLSKLAHVVDRRTASLRWKPRRMRSKPPCP